MGRQFPIGSIIIYSNRSLCYLMLIMDECICGSKATLKCMSCRIVLCESHAGVHIRDNYGHFVAVNTMINNGLRVEITKKLASKNQKIEHCKSEIDKLSRLIKFN